MEGIFIPKEILELQGISSTEKIVLSLYKYYTEQGKNKCCSLNKTQIADELFISVDSMKKIKKHLKELGYIRTDGGVRVIYLGVQGGNIVPTKGGIKLPTRGENITPQGGLNYPEGGIKLPTKGVKEYPHKKEKKEKEEKKEEKWVTNIKLLFSRLPRDYQTPERLNYIKDTYKERLDDIDFSEGCVLDNWVMGIRNKLNEVFPIEFVIKKEEPKSDTIDVF